MYKCNQQPQQATYNLLLFPQINALHEQLPDAVKGYFSALPAEVLQAPTPISFFYHEQVFISLNTLSFSNRTTAINLLRDTFANCKGFLKGSVQVFLPDCLSANENEELAEVMLLAFSLHLNPIYNLKTQGDTSNVFPNLLLVGNQDWDDIFSRASKMSDIQIQMRDWVNKPANHKTPFLLGEWFCKRALALGAEAFLLQGAELKELGLNCILAVGKGSANAPCMAVAHYKPQNAKHKIGLVGKGVTFDTGGISLKDSINMHFQKNDMAGAAGLMGAFLAIATAQLPIEVKAVFPLVENMIGEHAMVPGDILQAFDKQTIEVLDTDAEGRLVLADALAYLLANYEPDYLIDMATLTGSAFTTFGTHAGALFCTDDAFGQELIKSGYETDEKVWPLPLWDAYAVDIQSDVADFRNYPGRPVAGAIVAAKFLQAFTKKHPKWAHIDMAGMSFQDSKYTKLKAATGYGIRLIFNWAKSVST